MQFYRVYHSMRYVQDQLVLRLQRELSPPLLDAINEQFADMLVDGQFDQTTALAGGARRTGLEEPAAAGLLRSTAATWDGCGS